MTLLTKSPCATVRRVILDVATETVGQSTASPHVRPDGPILALDARRRDVARIADGILKRIEYSVPRHSVLSTRRDERGKRPVDESSTGLSPSSFRR
jgi:hypothetical protein